MKRILNRDFIVNCLAYISAIFIVIGVAIGSIFLVFFAFLVSKIGLILAIVTAIGIAYKLWGF